MTPPVWFSIANPFALLGWVMLIAALLAPAQGAWRQRLLWLAGRVWPLMLGLGYAAALVAHWGSAPGGGFGTLDEVAALFRSPGNLLAGWLHYLAFDLFIGRWVVDDATSRGLQGHARWALLPCLLLIFLFGPVGLLLYFGLRHAVFSQGVAHGR
ncbi:MAG: ABA4-like family protein [Aquabacterium sp.]|nr:ABA4-like family protein [Aquabacterium sp.]